MKNWLKKKEGETNHFQIKPVEICCQQSCTTINAKKVSCGREMIPGENVNLYGGKKNPGNHK